MTRIAVVGAGAVGCYLAARLSDGGHQITLVARGDQRAAIARDGLLLREPHGEARRYRLQTVETLVERPDLVLLAVKTPDVAQACAAIRPFVAGVPVLALQNGVRADHIAASVLGREAVLGAVVMCAASYVQPGEVFLQFPGWLILGEPFRSVDDRARDIARVLDRALPTYITPHLRRVRWSKLIANLNNALCAATGLTAPEVGSTPLGRMLSLQVMKEGAAVALTAGIRFDHGLYGLSPRALRRDPHAALFALLQASFTTLLVRLPERAALQVLAAAGRSRLNRLPVRFSLWQSIVRGRPSEIDYLNGEIVRLGARVGRPTPYNAHLVALVRQVARTQTFCRLEDLVPPEARRFPVLAPAAGGQ
ncbi:MAG TPA: 2-dehydropantoate 2-reductase [Chloroflexota bacterium]|jgi:2-dehydropantoate 2-reductase|nr:2-dehydropantoate 2-reductase [Chloroflexota bacterium]